MHPDYFPKKVVGWMHKLLREGSNITSAQWSGVEGLTQNAEAADALRRGGGLRSKLMM